MQKGTTRKVRLRKGGRDTKMVVESGVRCVELRQTKKTGVRQDEGLEGSMEGWQFLALC